jgi:hypothetical protein
MTKFSLALGAVFVSVAASTCSADLKILNFDPARNDRFNGSSSFIANGFDLSGVGKQVGSASAYVNNSDGARWATLISPSFALTANHFSPGVGDTITFVSGNSVGGASVTDTVASAVNILGPNSDLQLIRLTTAVTTPGINFFPIVADNQAALSGAPMFVYGQSNRVGTNNIDPGSFQFFPNVGGSNPGVGYTYTFDPNSPNPNEAELQAADSGGPSFVTVNGVLALVGTHWFNFTGTDANGNPIEGSGDTYVPNYINDINAAMAAQGSSERVTVVSAVPEPASILLIAVGVPGVMSLMRRRKRAEYAAAA